MKKSSRTLIKLILVFLAFIGGFILFRNNRTPKYTIAIVHNNQDVNKIYDVLLQYEVGMADIDTTSLSDDMIDELIADADGVIFAGGNDFNPDIYGGDSDLVEYFNTNDDYDSLRILDKCIADNKPILGLCRGLQLINIYYGGSLYEDIPSQYSTDVIHRGENKSVTYHPVNISSDTRLYQIIQTDYIDVNSYHHEAIKDLGDGLRVGATSDDGLIEAIENPYYPYMVAVQWHPEFSYFEDVRSQMIFDDFISFVREEKNLD